MRISKMILKAEGPWSLQMRQMAGATGCREKGGCRGLQRCLQVPRLPNIGRPGGGGPCPCPLTLFHLLCFHIAPPSSQLWDGALRAPSDPPGSAFVTAHPSNDIRVIISLWISRLFIFLIPVNRLSWFLFLLCVQGISDPRLVLQKAINVKRLMFHLLHFYYLNDPGMYAVGITGGRF